MSAHTTGPGALTLFVGALPRGGAGLVATMLAAGGAPVGEAPADPALSVAGARGHALPLLDPHDWPRGHALFALRPAMAVFVTRDLRDLASSQLARRDTGRPELRLEAASHTRTGRIADLLIAQSNGIGAFKREGIPVWQLRFESVLADPLAGAAFITGQLRPWWRLDAAAMAAAVRVPVAAGAASDLAREYGL